MATSVLAPPKPKAPPHGADSWSGNNGGNGFGGGRDGGSGASAWRVPARAYRTGMYMALAAIVMLFAAFTSAMVVRKGLNGDWVGVVLPRVLYVNTAVLLLSSLTLELSRRSLLLESTRYFTRWLYSTVLLGLAFVVGQLWAWKELAARGVYLATNPSSSFFYLLTAAHGMHLLGGIIALFYIAARAQRLSVMRGHSTAVDVSALYWHFMDGLWIYLLILLTVRL